MAGCQVGISRSVQQKVTTCPNCGGWPTHLRGATGRISVCPRCGWSRIEPREQQIDGAREEVGQDDGQ